MSAADVREPAVAGQFYPGDAHALRAAIAAHVEGGSEPALGHIGAMVPHAGYRYSGDVAGATYARVLPRRRVVLLGVNHHGRGQPVAASPARWWRTPLGEIEIDREMTQAIRRRAGFLCDDARAHASEHSLEVQVPFLQIMSPTAPIVTAIALATHDLATLAALGHAIAAAVTEVDRETLILASTDMNHYESAAISQPKDRLALERVMALDGPGLLATVIDRDISMCGVAPTVVALVAARDLGATRAELVRYANSGDVTGDYGSVVGYAGAVFS